MSKPMERIEWIGTTRYTLSATYRDGEWWPAWTCDATDESGTPDGSGSTSDEAFELARAAV